MSRKKKYIQRLGPTWNGRENIERQGECMEESGRRNEGKKRRKGKNWRVEKKGLC